MHTATALLPVPRALELTSDLNAATCELELATHDWPWKDDASCTDDLAATRELVDAFAAPMRGVVTAVDAAEVHAMAAIAAMPAAGTSNYNTSIKKIGCCCYCCN